MDREFIRLFNAVSVFGVVCCDRLIIRCGPMGMFIRSERHTLEITISGRRLQVNEYYIPRQRYFYTDEDSEYILDILKKYICAIDERIFILDSSQFQTIFYTECFEYYSMIK